MEDKAWSHRIYHHHHHHYHHHFFSNLNKSRDLWFSGLGVKERTRYFQQEPG
jgi:hypothetical protein